MDSATSTALTSADATIITSTTSNVDVMAPAGDITLGAPTGTITIDGAVEFTQGISGISSLISEGQILVQSTGDNIYLTADKNIFVTAESNNIELTADDHLVMATTTGYASLSAATNASMTAAAGAATITATNPSGNAVAASLVSAGAGNYTQLKSTEDGKHIFTIGDHDALEIYKTSVFDPSDSNNVTGYKVKINADFEVAGNVNSIGVTQTELQIEDKILHLAFNSNLELPYDGVTNDGAGMVIDGVPSDHDDAILASNPERYEKSIRWNMSTGGMLALGSSNIATESYWEVQGGAMRWTHVNESTGKETSYILRINEREEFEMVKRSKEVGQSESFTKVSKFGRIIA